MGKVIISIREEDGLWYWDCLPQRGTSYGGGGSISQPTIRSNQGSFSSEKAARSNAVEAAERQGYGVVFDEPEM